MSSMRLTLALLLSSIAWTARSADDLESLDEDFLSYLAEFEGDEDDWTIVEPAPAPTAPAAKPASPSGGKSPTTEAKQQTKTATSQPTKPATPDDGNKR